MHINAPPPRAKGRVLIGIAILTLHLNSIHIKVHYFDVFFIQFPTATIANRNALLKYFALRKQLGCFKRRILAAVHEL